MYEGGNTRYRYEIVKTWIFIGVIAVLVILLASFKMIDDKYCGRLENHDLNPSQNLFCILYHIGKTDEEVMQILQYSLSNVRVR